MSWEKVSKVSYRNTVNGAFIAVFNWCGERVPLVYLNEEQYRKCGADYKSCKNLKEAKVLGADIGSLGLIEV